jgi:hypothetical protein
LANLSIDNPTLHAGAAVVLARFGHQLQLTENPQTTVRITTRPSSDGTIRIQAHVDGHIEIFYALGQTLARPFTSGYTLEKHILIDHLGTMLDCSRNAAFRVETIQKLLVDLALFGMDELYLYLEDLYEIESYPYFGYLRGRYTPVELAAIQECGASLGIEIIPCIQTLAHLRSTLHWEYAAKLKDTDDILLVDSPEVRIFLEHLLKAVSTQFKTKKIHLGMDEADALGLGNYLKQHGYANPKELIVRHLKLVVDICGQLSLEPMVWSDMFLRPLSPTAGYYDVPLPVELAQTVSPPAGTTLVYWDYYHCNPDFLARYLKLHRELSPEVAFAGGAWTWNGIAPNYSLALETTKVALETCVVQGIQRALCTLWFDNGAETPLQTALPMLADFSSYGYGPRPSPIEFGIWFHSMSGISWESYLLLDLFDAVPGTEIHNQACDNPSKWLLYQDPLVGLFDTYILGNSLGMHYAQLRRRLEQAKTGPNGSLLFSYYRQLAKVLEDKAELGINLIHAYEAQDIDTLKRIATVVMPRCREAVLDLKGLREQIWFAEAKPFGFEVLDLRLGGIATRLESSTRRILAFCTGEFTHLEELEEKRLPYREREVGSTRKFCACNTWRDIISAASI